MSDGDEKFCAPLYMSVLVFCSGDISLREVVSNFRESGDRSKKSTFFLFAPKDPFGESFSKIIFKSSNEFLFWKKIRKFEID